MGGEGGEGEEGQGIPLPVGGGSRREGRGAAGAGGGGGPLLRASAVPAGHDAAAAGDPRAAYEAYKVAIAADPTNADALNNIAQTLGALRAAGETVEGLGVQGEGGGYEEEQARYYRMALAASPSHAHAAKNLAELTSAHRRTEEEEQPDDGGW